MGAKVSGMSELKVKARAQIWLTSDYHLGHENIIRFSNRPFANVKEMDEALLTYHNELVKPQDHVYNLGDVTLDRGGQKQRGQFIRLMRKFHGHKRLLLGNHDHFPIQTYLEAGFEKIYATWRGIDNLMFSHVPIHPMSMGSATANIHGHIHDNVSPSPVVWGGYEERPLAVPKVTPYVNVCVEWTEYRPIAIEDVHVRIRNSVDWWREEQDGKSVGV